jgi:uncharacterized delta-60 repeat protein
VTRSLREEHHELAPRVESLQVLADRVSELRTEELLTDFEEAEWFLMTELLPHAAAEERWLYPAVGDARVFRGNRDDEPRTTWRSGGRRTVRRAAIGNREGAGPPSQERELRRLLYGPPRSDPSPLPERRGADQLSSVVNRKVVGNQALPERRFVMIAVRRRTVFAAAVACALAALSTNTALASPGDLDITFGGVGKVTTDFTKGFDAANAVAIEADGKIVAAGVAKNGQVFALARYNSDGILDTTFGDHGKVTTNFTAENDVAKGVAMQDDGKIVGVGQAGTAQGSSWRATTRTARSTRASAATARSARASPPRGETPPPPSRSRPTGRSSRREPPTRIARARSMPWRGTTPTGGSTRASAATAR